MIHLVPLAFALAALAVPLLVAPHRAVAGVGLVGVLLVGVGIASFWRWPFTAAAALFLGEHAAALLLAGDASPGLIASAGLGVAIVLLLQSADLTVRARHAVGGAAVLRAQLIRWLVLGGGGLAGAGLGTGLAVALAPALPAAAAPFLAGAGVLGIVIGVAALAVRAARRPPARAE